MRFTCLSFILILNLHMISAGDSVLPRLEKRMTHAESKIDPGNENVILLEEKINIDNNNNFSPADLIAGENYPVEIHNVITEDGYILTLFRIPGRFNATPVYMQHGLLEDSGLWLLSGREKSLAYQLWDNGYDVWLGNARGNTYSKMHQTLSSSDPKFWDFSWQELGVYDHPAVINYITNISGKRLFYIGHSMAATTFSVMAIERPEVASKVKVMIGLAPATYVYHLRAPLRILVPYWRLLQSIIPSIWSQFPAGTSMKLFIHWLQQINVNQLRKFDYGEITNMKMYNSPEPPVYDLSKMHVPTALIWSENDWLVGRKDVEHFYNELPFKIGMYKVEDPKFNHFDFVWGADAPKLVYNKVINLLNAYNN